MREKKIQWHTHVVTHQIVVLQKRETGRMSQLTSVMTQSQQVYRPGLWAVLLHQIPHVNITFHRIHDDR